MVFLASIAEIGFIILGAMLFLASFLGQVFGAKFDVESAFLLILGGLIIYLSIHFGPINISLGGE